MIVSLPASATCMVPLTGARRKPTPACSSRAAISADSAGATVAKSTKRPGRGEASSTPSGPRITLLRAGPSVRLLSTMSLPVAASAGDPATAAPFSARAIVFSGVRFQTVTSCPAASRRADMREPITPMPRKPMRATDYLLVRRPDRSFSTERNRRAGRACGMTVLRLCAAKPPARRRGPRPRFLSPQPRVRP